jgi:negative regulator of sigma E activity
LQADAGPATFGLGIADLGTDMSDDRRQRLSALVDGEGGPAQFQGTLAETLLDPELRACWARYIAIGRVLRGEPVHADINDVAARVAATIAAEPGPGVAPAAPATTVPRAAVRRRAAAAGPIVGVALAAGLAMVAVVVGPKLGQTVGTYDAPSVADAAPPGPSAAPLERWAAATPDVASRLNELVVNHRERSAASGFGGLIPYAAVVGYASPR